MNRNKYLIPLPLCHPHYSYPPSRHIWNSVQDYNVSKASLCNRIQSRGEFFKTPHQSELERPVLNFSLTPTEDGSKGGYKSWSTLLKMLHCCQYLSIRLSAATYASVLTHTASHHPAVQQLAPTKPRKGQAWYESSKYCWLVVFIFDGQRVQMPKKENKHFPSPWIS